MKSGSVRGFNHILHFLGFVHQLLQIPIDSFESQCVLRKLGPDVLEERQDWKISECNKYGTKLAEEGKQNHGYFKTGRFDNVEAAVIISSVSKAVKPNLCCRNLQLWEIQPWFYFSFLRLKKYHARLFRLIFIRIIWFFVFQADN